MKQMYIAAYMCRPPATGSDHWFDYDVNVTASLRHRQWVVVTSPSNHQSSPTALPTVVCNKALADGGDWNRSWSLFFLPAVTMVNICVVKFCSNSHLTGHSVHCFPKNELFRRGWVDFVRFYKSEFLTPKPHSKTGICRAHFTPACFTSNTKEKLGYMVRVCLKKDAVPTIQPELNQQQVLELGKQRGRKRAYPTSPNTTSALEKPGSPAKQAKMVIRYEV